MFRGALSNAGQILLQQIAAADELQGGRIDALEIAPSPAVTLLGTVQVVARGRPPCEALR